jgi:hypothetical protein
MTSEAKLKGNVCVVFNNSKQGCTFMATVLSDKVVFFLYDTVVTVVLGAEKP